MIDSKEFNFWGSDVELGSNVTFLGKDRIYIGNNVEIKSETTIAVNINHAQEGKQPNLIISDYVFINKYVGIEVFNSIEIGKYVAFGPNIYISDGNHCYQNIYVPVAFQGFKLNNNKIHIKDGAWLGAGVKVFGNVTVGFGSVVGANSVIVKDVPDHAVVVGNPAQLIKIFDYKSNCWADVKNNPKRLSRILKERGSFPGYDYEEIERQIHQSKVGNIMYTRLREIEPRLTKILKLIDSSLESLEAKIPYPNNSEAIASMTVFAQGIDVLNKAIQPIFNNYINKRYQSIYDELVQSMHQLVINYHNNQSNKAKHILTSVLKPLFNSWSIEVQQAFKTNMKCGI